IVRNQVDWPWFVASQFVFGVVLALVVMSSDRARRVPAGLLGGAIGGVLMSLPAIVWGLLTKHGIWYPINLLAVMILPQGEDFTVETLEEFDPQWLLAATALHAVLSLSFGVLFGLLVRRLPRIPGPFAWGALLMPLLWTATSYGLMGVVNPALQQR